MKFDFQVVPSKKAASTLALSKPDIGPNHAGDGTDIDDVTRTLPPHDWQRGLHHMHDAVKVRCELMLDLGGGICSKLPSRLFKPLLGSLAHRLLSTVTVATKEMMPSASYLKTFKPPIHDRTTINPTHVTVTPRRSARDATWRNLVNRFINQLGVMGRFARI